MPMAASREFGQSFTFAVTRTLANVGVCRSWSALFGVAYPCQFVALAVNTPYQVVHDETVYTPGQTVDVPQDVADKWIQAGWVSEAKATKTAPPKKR